MSKKTSTKKVGKSRKQVSVNGQKSRPTAKAKAKRRKSPTAEELTFLAWQYIYENRHRRLQ